MDGFLPKRKKLEELYITKFPGERSGRTTYDISKDSVDDLVSNLLDDLHDQHERSYGCRYSHLYLRHNYGIAPRVSALVNELDERSSVPSKKEYRQIITVCDLEHEGTVRSCVKEIRKYLKFEIRKDYGDRKSFESSVRGLLELVVEPFAFPQSAAARQLREFALEKLSSL